MEVGSALAPKKKKKEKKLYAFVYALISVLRLYWGRIIPGVLA